VKRNSRLIILCNDVSNDVVVSSKLCFFVENKFASSDFTFSSTWSTFRHYSNRKSYV